MKKNNAELESLWDLPLCNYQINYSLYRSRVYDNDIEIKQWKQR